MVVEIQNENPYEKNIKTQAVGVSALTKGPLKWTAKGMKWSTGNWIVLEASFKNKQIILKGKFQHINL